MNQMNIALDAVHGKPYAWIYIESTGERPLRQVQSWADVNRLAQEFSVEDRTIGWTIEALRWAESNWGPSPTP